MKETRKIPVKKQLEVLRLYLQGYRYAEIVKLSEVSKGSVVNIIKKFRAGDFPGFDSFVDLFDELRSLAIQLKKRGFGLSEALLGLAFINRITGLVEPEVLDDYIELCNNIIPSDFPRDKFVETSIRLIRLEDELGKPFEEALRDLEKTLADTSAKKAKVTARLKAAKKRKIKIDTQLREATKQLAATKNELKASIKGHQNLEKLGLDEVSKLATFGVEIKELGYRGANFKKLIKLVKRKPKLEKRTATLQKRIKVLTEEIRFEEVKKEAIITGNDVLLAIQSILENQAICVECQNCDNLVVVPIPDISTLKVHLRLGWIYSPKCQYCDSLNVINPSDILTKIGFSVLASQVYDRI